MAHSLNLSVVAECIETEAQFRALKDPGCDEYQGITRPRRSRRAISRSGSRCAREWPVPAVAGGIRLGGRSGRVQRRGQRGRRCRRRPSSPAAGSVDAAFGDGGKVVVDSAIVPSAMEVDATGNVYLNGSVIAKLDARGRPVTAFGSGGAG